MAGGARSFILGLLIVGATVCLVLGLTLPIMRLTKLYFWTDAHSLISIVTELYKGKEVFLAAVVCLFSIVFPALKLLYLLALYSASQASPPQAGVVLRRMAWLGKWSMLDVLILALVIFYAKSTQLADAVSMPGIYMFTGAVVLTMLAYGIVEHDLDRAPMRQEPSAAEESRPPIERSLHPILGTSRAKL